MGPNRSPVVPECSGSYGIHRSFSGTPIMQTRGQTILEVCISTACAFVIAMITQALIFPLYNIHATASTNFQLTLIFTVVSLIRSYYFRRFFNRLFHSALYLRMVNFLFKEVV